MLEKIPSLPPKSPTPGKEKKILTLNGMEPGLKAWLETEGAKRNMAPSRFAMEVLELVMQREGV